jgi:uncharacterized membrane protein YjfL (UPF0719 family)
MLIIKEYFILFGWAVAGGLSMAVILPIVLKVFTFINPTNEWEEIKKGNIGISIILSSVILSTAIVIAYAIS